MKPSTPSTPSTPSPVPGLRSLLAAGTGTSSEPFADDGQLMSASAAAIEHNGHLLIGSVIQELVHCKISDKGIYQF